jgi:diguanylate cyclase (GGDEF)-like protein
MLALAEAVRVRLSRPYLTSRGQLSISTSIGVCVVPCTAENPSEVLRDADAALYAAKAAGKNLVKVFDQEVTSTPDLEVTTASPIHDRAADVRS